MSTATWAQTTLATPSRGRGLHDITAPISRFVQASELEVGLCHVFIQHTSASLVIQENADPDVQHDLAAWFERTVEDGDPRYRHRAEGPDDMSAHIRSALTQTSLTVPIVDGRLGLGMWQGIYLFEHRTGRFERRVVITLSGAREAS